MVEKREPDVWGLTPICSLQYASISRPYHSEKYGTKKYKVDCVAKEELWSEFMSTMQDVLDRFFVKTVDEAFLKLQMDMPKQAEKYSNADEWNKAMVVEGEGFVVRKMPFKKVLDDEGEYTGMLRLNANEKHEWVKKETGQKWDMKPEILDGQNNPIEGDLYLDPESVGRVNGVINPYLFGKEIGVSFKLRKVQVIKRVDWEGSSGQAFPTVEMTDDDIPF